MCDIRGLGDITYVFSLSFFIVSLVSSAIRAVFDLVRVCLFVRGFFLQIYVCMCCIGDHFLTLVVFVLMFSHKLLAQSS